MANVNVASHPTPWNAKQAAEDVTIPDDLTLIKLRKAIPAECFDRSFKKSISYFIRDLIIIGLLYLVAYRIDQLPLGQHARIAFWLVWGFAQGTMFWALFVVGHDCGHQSFSDSRTVNNFFGHLAHSPLLVPYHGWRISHRNHHQNHGNVANDESWHPCSQAFYEARNAIADFIRFKVVLFTYPIYLWVNAPERDGRRDHFIPGSRLFKPEEASEVMLSSACDLAFMCVLLWFGYNYGWDNLGKYYGIPYWVFAGWLGTVTFLHHTEPSIPWYRGDSWSYLKGALSTTNRRYGLFEDIHHNIGTHIVHHLFSTIPHYNLKKADAAIQPVLGDIYKKRNMRDLPIVAETFRSLRECKYVPNTGNVVYYHADVHLKNK